MADVPALMLELHADLRAWLVRDPKGAQAALTKAALHTEYLTGRSVILSLASEKVSIETKDAMATKLKRFPANWQVDMGKPKMPTVFEFSKLEDFINEESWHFFQVNFVTTDVKKVKKQELMKAFPLNRFAILTQPSCHGRLPSGSTMRTTLIFKRWSMGSLLSMTQQNALSNSLPTSMGKLLTTRNSMKACFREWKAIVVRSQRLLGNREL